MCLHSVNTMGFIQMVTSVMCIINVHTAGVRTVDCRVNYLYSVWFQPKIKLFTFTFLSFMYATFIFTYFVLSYSPYSYESK